MFLKKNLKGGMGFFPIFPSHLAIENIQNHLNNFKYLDFHFVIWQIFT